MTDYPELKTRAGERLHMWMHSCDGMLEIQGDGSDPEPFCPGAFEVPPVPCGYYDFISEIEQEAAA